LSAGAAWITLRAPMTLHLALLIAYCVVIMGMGLFVGQSNEFFQFMGQLATDADAATRQC